MFMVGMGNYSIIKLFIYHDNRDFFGNNRNVYIPLTSNNRNQQLYRAIILILAVRILGLERFFPYFGPFSVTPFQSVSKSSH